MRRYLEVGVWVNMLEYNLVRKAAEAEGKSMSSWAREVLLREAKKVLKKAEGQEA